jgi:hypothetical protein
MHIIIIIIYISDPRCTTDVLRVRGYDEINDTIGKTMAPTT